MSPFGRKDDEKQQLTEQWRRAMQAELDRLAALPLAELAAEVMIRGFGSGSPGADDGSRAGKRSLSATARTGPGWVAPH